MENSNSSDNSKEKNNLHTEINFSQELLKGFHTQFAENQRTREQSFLKIIGFLGAVILGYVYTYKYSSDVNEFELVFIAGNFLLLCGASIVAAIAYSFRRDQYVNTRIRRKANIIGSKEVFPEGYDPTKKKRSLYLWMPDIFVIFFLLFPIFQIMLMISFFIKLKLKFDLVHCDWDINITLFIFFILFAFSSFFIPYYYKNKLKNNLSLWESEYNKSNDS